MWPKPPRIVKRRNFSCKICAKKFRTRQALGGHMSKLHPGSSEKYKRKLMRREERVNDRYVHSLAKEIHEGLV